MSIDPGVLYVVATPIGNLGDMTSRAVEVLRSVDRIAAEDTRHSARLLRHFAIDTPMLALHEHNERVICAGIIARLQQGENIALISDAGTPLVSDPGYHLVSAAHDAAIRVVPVPGPSALVAALSVSGLPTDRFAFEGFLPAKKGARRARLEALVKEPRTMAFFEAPHRLLATLEDMVELIGAERLAVLARELTKTFETVRRGTLGELLSSAAADADQQRGEMVILVAGAREEPGAELDAASRHLVEVLAAELPLKQAAALAARITGGKKNRLYQYALTLAKRD